MKGFDSNFLWSDLKFDNIRQQGIMFGVHLVKLISMWPFWFVSVMSYENIEYTKEGSIYDIINNLINVNIYRKSINDYMRIFCNIVTLSLKLKYKY